MPFKVYSLSKLSRFQDFQACMIFGLIKAFRGIGLIKAFRGLGLSKPFQIWGLSKPFEVWTYQSPPRCKDFRSFEARTKGLLQGLHSRIIKRLTPGGSLKGLHSRIILGLTVGTHVWVTNAKLIYELKFTWVRGIITKFTKGVNPSEFWDGHLHWQPNSERSWNPLSYTLHKGI